MGSLSWFGDGEHARVVAESAAAAGWVLLGPVADAEAAVAERRAAHPEGRFIIAFGSQAGRRALAERLARLPWATVIHPAAVVSRSAHLGAGTWVGPLALVHAGAAVGEHAIINSGALIEHDVAVGDHVHCAPGVVVGGGAILGLGCFLGLGARVRDHVQIGPGARVGMGAVVVRDVPAGATALGCPARER